MGDFASAVSLHQSGRVREAERAYRALLAATPDQPDVLHALGVLRHQSGDSEAAADLLARAAALTPGRAEYHFNLGLALFRLNRLAEAALIGLPRISTSATRCAPSASRMKRPAPTARRCASSPITSKPRSISATR
jgi:predicted Zn-dependent protease